MEPVEKAPPSSKPAERLGLIRDIHGRRLARFGQRCRYLGFLALVSVGAALLVTLFFCPRFVMWRGLKFPAAWNAPELNRAISTFKQIDQPFAPATDISNRVIAWRLLFPVVWHYLALPNWLFLIMPHLGSLLTLALTAHIVFERTANRCWTFLATVLVAACSWFFVSSGWLAYFDSWLMGGLLLLAFGKSRVALAIVCLLVPWIEDRFLLAAPLCFVIRLVDIGPAEQQRTKNLIWDGAVIGLASLVYPLLRILLAQFGLASAELGAYARQYFTWERIASCSPRVYLDAIWSGLRAGWFFVAVLLWSLWAAGRRRLDAIFAVLLVGTIAVGLVVAADLSRNVGLIVPVALMGVVDLARRRPKVLRVALPVIVAANLLLPAAHVVTAFEGPVVSLYSEIQRWRTPPPELDPNVYTQQGIRLLEQGNLDQATAWVEAALKLDARFGPAYVARAGIRLQRSDFDGARQDLDLAIQLNPQDADAYLARAFVRRQSQNDSGAVLDLQTALRLAPPDWPHWQEARGLLDKWSTEEPTKALIH